MRFLLVIYSGILKPYFLLFRLLHYISSLLIHGNYIYCVIQMKLIIIIIIIVRNNVLFLNNLTTKKINLEQSEGKPLAVSFGCCHNTSSYIPNKHIRANHKDLRFYKTSVKPFETSPIPSIPSLSISCFSQHQITTTRVEPFKK